MSTHTAPAAWSKSNPSWGSALRVQRNAYAFTVTMALTGGAMVCPACGTALDLDTALDYTPGNVVYLCGGAGGCNQSRSRLQSMGRDWTNLDAYADAVTAASAGVPVPSQAAAKRWWSNRPTGGTRVSRWA
jgi:hypothetical protein